MVDVLTLNSVPIGFYPARIVLNINYQQVDKKTKKIIEATISFEEQKKLTYLENIGSKAVAYVLVINFTPLSHTQLMNLFAFDVSFYLTLYMIIGLVTIVLASLVAFYHRIFTNIKPTPKFKL